MWFNPEALGGDVPTSWSDFISFCDALAAEGQACTAGLALDSWTLSILFEDVYLATYGPEQYVALVTGEIPFTDASMVETFNRIATFYGDTYAVGGSAGALGTGLVDGLALVFGENPEAKFVAAGSWAGGIVAGAINANVVEGETIDYVPFPGEEVGAGSIVATADVAVMLADSPEARQLLSYLMSVEGQSLFAPNGYTVANSNIDPALYTGLAANSADLLATSTVVPATGAVMSNELRTVLLEAVAASILDRGSIEAYLENLQASVE
jgi:hypothetical protein